MQYRFGQASFCGCRCSKDAGSFCMLFTLWEIVRTYDCVSQGLAVKHYAAALEALILKSAGFCGVRVDREHLAV